MVTSVSRFEIWLISLDPTKGSEIQKTRPCVIVSPDEMNRWLRTLIVAPMISSAKNYPSRVPIRFDGKDGQVALDQIRTIDRSRLIRRLGAAETDTAMALSEVLVEMFRFGEG